MLRFRFFLRRVRVSHISRICRGSTFHPSYEVLYNRQLITVEVSMADS